MTRTGRPRAFDRDLALTNAMHLFWEKSFDGASLTLLRDAMGGISAASFYAAFGSKEALYREALALYLGTHGRAVSALHDIALPPRKRLETALRRSARMQTASSHPAGCMVALPGMPSGVAATEIAALTATERSANRAAIRRGVEDALASGELRTGVDAVGLAALFEGVLVGLSIQARDGVDLATLEGAISAAMVAWDSAAV